ncbi:malonyl CoA-acyl carrier protein transacylase [Microbacterium sp. SORGH_AS 969]|nr:malonyl CoA-acyl carrier protein transacylase [Microbacterium sp. SORGH_AS_0969]
MIIAVFPGQGSQTPGFLTPWLELDGARERLAAYSEQAGVDLIAAGTEWDADRIRDTSVAQPLIVAASLLSWSALTQRSGSAVAGVAGHSVGEIAALAASGVLTEDDALRLVGLRGRAMAEAAAVTETGMSAVVGGDEAVVLERLEALGLTPANYNGGGQIVAAGELPALAELAAEAPRGARVIPLQVAGAFHTRFMEPAVERRCVRQLPVSRCPTRVSPSGPTPTVPSSPRGAALSTSSSRRSRRPCAGIAAWLRSPSRA